MRRRRPKHTRRAASDAEIGRSRPILSRFPPIDILTEAELEQIQTASDTILARTGVIFNQPDALQYFRRAGARVEENRVWLEADLVQDALARAPAGYLLHARNPQNSVRVGKPAETAARSASKQPASREDSQADETGQPAGGLAAEFSAANSTVVMPGGGPAFVRDLDGVRRPGRLSDLENFCRLSQLSAGVHVVARKAVEPQDVPVADRHLQAWRAVLCLTDKPAQSGFIGGRREAQDVLEMLAIAFGSLADIDGRPVAHCSVNVNSPLFYDTAMLEGMLEFANLGQPVLISPFVMAGVSGPTTLAGTLAQQNAEVLAGITLAQLVRPGTPVLYGAATSNVDLRNASPAIGSPESALSTAACAQLARSYGLPIRGGGALTDAPSPDAQSNYERMFTLMASVLSGVHFMMHGLGILESYLSISYEQFVIDLDLLEMVRRFVAGIEVSAETLALDTIDDVGPGGFFLDAAHTLRHYRDAHFFPNVGIRQPFEQWESEGSLDTVARANARCRELLAQYEPPPIADRTRAELDALVSRRRSK